MTCIKFQSDLTVVSATDLVRDSLQHFSLHRARLLGLSWVRFPNSHLHVYIYMGASSLLSQRLRLLSDFATHVCTCLSLPTLESVASPNI